MDLETERKLLRPDEPAEVSETHADGARGSESLKDQDGEQDDKRNQISDSEVGSDDEDQSPRVVNRRISDRATTLKRKREESERKVERQKKVKAETKEAKQYLKVLDDIQNKKDEIRAVEEEVEGLDDDLRQNSCYRTKVIGRDRYFNRYYWFERNAMDFEGDSDSAVAAERYANGRFWIQGPDKLDRHGIIDMDPEDEKKYRQQAGMTVQERKNLEEGSTKLESASEWGFYDTPEELDGLIAWLEKKGEREKTLRRDLEQCRSQIVDCMERRKKHFVEVQDKHDAMENKVVGIATRKKTNVDATNIKYPCTLWKNTTALSSIGQLHSDGPVAKKGRKQQRKPREESAVPEARTTRQGARNK